MVMVNAGTRVGFWKPGAWLETPFKEMGIYTGESLGDCIPGKTFEQPLMDGTVKFRIGVLFRPDLSKYQKLETIIILDNLVEEMWDYDTWEKVG